MATATPSSRTPNRLIHEKSPYLLQHAYNPVDWYPWSDEAFERAKREHKPVFLSIGYSTCHWCHVMERESFENPGIATLMNQWFVNIKVDREEHPDLDQVYLRAVTALTGHGGWPLTVFLTPDRKPFFGGTYFPPEQRWNMPGMKELLPSVAEAWQRKPEEIARSADELTDALQRQLRIAQASTAISPEWLHQAFNQAAMSFDPSAGGFGQAPKFPRPHELSFLLHYWARTGAAQALEMVTTTLDRMAAGGLRDHLGGGFHRYSTDAQWLVPHFEKMLYDQALLARVYFEAYRVTKRHDDADIGRQICDYVLKDLRDPQGGFYAAEDADSEGKEGTFYVWTPAEVLRELGQEEGELFNRFYGVTPEGHLEGGASLLHIEQPLEAFAKLKGLPPDELRRRLAASRTRLSAARARRVRPHRDDKILTSWNGLMIASLAYGAATVHEPRYLEAAQQAADFILTTLRPHGELLRRYRDGEAAYPGTLEDYAFLTYGLLELYEASWDPRWLLHAKQLADRMIERFWDPSGGGFFLRSRTEEPLIVSSKDCSDGATPSGNSIAALVLLKLGRLIADAPLEDYGRKTLEGFAGTIERAPFGFPQLLIAADVALGPTREIVIAGDPASAATAALVDVLRQRFLPRAVVMLHPSGQSGDAIESLAPLVKARQPLNGTPTAYVCERYVCQSPVTSPEAFAALLDRSNSEHNR